MYINEKLHKEIEKKYLENLDLLKGFLEEDSKKIKDIKNLDHKYAMMFLYGHLPISDLSEDGIYNILFNNVKRSFFAKENTPWGNKIPVDIFLSDVLFPRVSSEILEDNRELFYNLLINRVEEKTMEEAVVEANYFSYENATYHATDRRTAPPTTLLKSAYGRCGEEAVFTVTALRAISIPARSVYTPVWAHTDNNHAWVEAWVEGEWKYLGACEPEEVLNRGWFTSAASRAMILESRSFFRTKEMNSSNEEYIKNGLAYNINLTKNYGNTKLVKVRVIDEKSQPIKDVSVSFNIINHASLVPLTKAVTDDNGEVSARLGLGNVTLHLSKENSFLDYQIHTENNNIELVFLEEKFLEDIRDFNTLAPVDPGNKVKKQSQEVIDNHKNHMKKALEIRGKKERDFLTPSRALTINNELIKQEDLEKILQMAKGNGENVIRFLENNPTKYAGLLLKTLNEKDYTDIEENILTSNLLHALKYIDDYNEEIFVEGILAPRIYFETLSDYRQVVEKHFDEATKEEFKKDPGQIWEYLKKNLKYIEEKEFPNTNVSIKGGLKTGYASKVASKILFVAIARSLGIPSRIAHDTVDIEYYNGEKFISPIEAEIRDSSLEITFEKGVNWVYGTNWSISRQENGEFIPLMLRNVEMKNNRLDLKNGNYKLLTTNRLPNGDVYARQYNLILKNNEKKDISISLREFSVESMINKVEVGDFFVSNITGEEKSLEKNLVGSKNALVWIKQNHEPSQHILNEILSNKNAFIKSKINLIFLIKDKNVLNNPLINQVVKELDIQVFIDKQFENQEPVARRVYVNPEELPLVILTKGGLNSIFATSGYNVGTADMILKILND